jgi:hypothetical protein
MAYLPQSNFQRRQNYLTKGSPLGGETSFSMEGDTRPPPSPTYQQGVAVGAGEAPIQKAPQQQQTPKPPLQEAQPLKAPEAIQQPPSFQKTGTLQQRLFQPLQTGSERGQESLGEAASFFEQEAGPSRTYEGIGAENLLKQAYTGGAAGDIERARGLIGAQYGGPQGLDQGTVAGLQNLLGQLQTRREALGTGGGLQTLIGQSVAGLTPGEARFEAKRLLPETKEQARDIGFQTVAPLSTRLMEERRGAQEFAQQRAQEEADIAKRSRGFLTGARGTIESDLQQRIAEAQAQQEREAQEYQDVLGADEGGRLAALRAANPELASQFDTEARRKDIEADRRFQQLMSDPKYAAVAQYDPLGLTITKRGKQFYAADGTDLRRVVPDKKTRGLLVERQQELEKLFDPGTIRPFTKRAAPGEFSTYSPLYGGEGFKALDPVDYLGFDPGTRPSRENLSSEEQREHFNNIQNIFENLDRIGEVEPFKAAEIFGQVDNYLEDEAKALEDKKGELSKANKEWLTQVNKARKKARKAKAKEAYGKIASVISGALPSAPGSDILKKMVEGSGQMPVAFMPNTSAR